MRRRRRCGCGSSACRSATRAGCPARPPGGRERSRRGRHGETAGPRRSRRAAAHWQDSCGRCSAGTPRPGCRVRPAPRRAPRTATDRSSVRRSSVSARRSARRGGSEPWGRRTSPTPRSAASACRELSTGRSGTAGDATSATVSRCSTSPSTVIHDAGFAAFTGSRLSPFQSSPTSHASMPRDGPQARQGPGARHVGLGERPGPQPPQDAVRIGAGGRDGHQPRAGPLEHAGAHRLVQLAVAVRVQLVDEHQGRG
jgi:hypothetical protein